VWQLLDRPRILFILHDVCELNLPQSIYRNHP